MASTDLKLNRSRMTKVYAQFMEHVRTPLYGNAYALIANQIASAGLGILYWLLAAHIYSPDVVGQNSAIISTIMGLGAFAELSLKSAMTRFVPRAGKNTIKLIVYTYSFNFLAAVVISSIFFLANSHLQFADDLFGDTPIWAAILVLTTVVWCIFYVQDGVLTGLRKSIWVLVKNSLFNISKLGLLLVGAALFYDYGIAISWFLPVPFLVLFFMLFIFRRLLRKHIVMTSGSASTITLRQIVTSVTGDHIGSLLAEACVRVLPLLVLAQAGKSENAYFYQAWLIASLFYQVADNIAYSFTVEAAANQDLIAVYSRRILGHMARLIVPMAVVVFIATPIGLSFYGAAYAREGTTLLRWLVVAGLPMMFNSWFLSYARVLNKIKAIIFVQGLLAGITVGLSYLWLPSYGITSIGVAWFTSEMVVATLVAFKMVPFLLSAKPRHAEKIVSQNRLLRRADWRWLSATPYPHRNVSFTDGLLAKSVAAISERVIDNHLASDGECDLAVAKNPDPVTLRAAYRALRAGGTCYTEWSAWRAGGASGIQRKLQAAGLNHVRLYLPFPTPIAPRLWMSVPGQRVLFQYLGNRFLPGHDPAHQFARAIFSRGLQLALRIGAVPHLSAIAYKGDPPTQDVFELTRAEWARARSAESTPSELAFLVQTGGSQLTSKIIFLAFTLDSACPRWVVKLPRVREDKTLRHEQNVLMELNSHNNSAVNGMVLPRMMFGCMLDGVWVSGQTALPGMPLNILLRRDNLRELALQLTDWQITLAQQSQNRPHTLDSRQAIEHLIDHVNEFAGAELIRQTRSILSKLDSVRLVCAHNDLAPWNIVQTADGLGVFDWADADWQGLPMLDLVYALTNVAFQLENVSNAAQRLALYSELVNGRRIVGGVFQDCLRRYAERVGLQSTQIAPLRLLTWVLHSNFEYQNLRIEEKGEATVALLPASWCTPLWQAEVETQTGQQ